jgi:hypothetical protein
MQLRHRDARAAHSTWAHRHDLPGRMYLGWDCQDLPNEPRNAVDQLALPGAYAARPGSVLSAHPHGAGAKDWPPLLDAGRRARTGWPAVACRRLWAGKLGRERPRRGRGHTQPRRSQPAVRSRGNCADRRGRGAPQIHHRDPRHPSLLRRWPLVPRRGNRGRVAETPGPDWRNPVSLARTRAR